MIRGMGDLLTFLDIDDNSAYTSSRQGAPRYGPDATRQDALLSSASQSRAAQSHVGDIRYGNDRNGGGYAYQPDRSRAGRRQPTFDKYGIRNEPVAPDDSLSVAGRSDATYDSKKSKTIVPGDSVSAIGQTRALDIRSKRGSATRASYEGDEDNSQKSNSQHKHGDGPIDDWVNTSQGDQAFATDSNAVEDWQTSARAIVDSEKKENTKGAYDRWYKTNRKTIDLKNRFNRLSTIDQGVCQPLLTEVEQVLERLEAKRYLGDSETEVASRASLTGGGDIEQGAGSNGDNKPSSGKNPRDNVVYDSGPKQESGGHKLTAGSDASRRKDSTDNKSQRGPQSAGSSSPVGLGSSRKGREADLGTDETGSSIKTGNHQVDTGKGDAKEALDHTRGQENSDIEPNDGGGHGSRPDAQSEAGHSRQTADKRESHTVCGLLMTSCQWL